MQAIHTSTMLLLHFRGSLESNNMPYVPENPVSLIFLIACELNFLTQDMGSDSSSVHMSLVCLYPSHQGEDKLLD